VRDIGQGDRRYVSGRRGSVSGGGRSRSVGEKTGSYDRGLQKRGDGCLVSTGSKIAFGYVPF
jgi:hypothetical protein